MSEMNGHGLDQAPKTTTEAATPALNKVDEILQNYMFPVFQAALNGSIVTNGQLPPDVVLKKACYVMGQVVGMSLSIDQGNLPLLLQVRNACRKAFEEGVARAAIRSAQAVAPAPGAGR